MVCQVFKDQHRSGGIDPDLCWFPRVYKTNTDLVELIRIVLVVGQYWNGVLVVGQYWNGVLVVGQYWNGVLVVGQYWNGVLVYLVLVAAATVAVAATFGGAILTEHNPQNMDAVTTISTPTRAALAAICSGLDLLIISSANLTESVAS